MRILSTYTNNIHHKLYKYGKGGGAAYGPKVGFWGKSTKFRRTCANKFTFFISKSFKYPYVGFKRGWWVHKTLICFYILVYMFKREKWTFIYICTSISIFYMWISKKIRVFVNENIQHMWMNLKLFLNITPLPPSLSIYAMGCFWGK